MYRDFETLNVNAEVDIHPDINFWLHEAQGLDEHEKFIYFYHKDHLGSSAQISDIDANIVHHIEYMPYGENFFEKRSHWSTRYKFNAKEKDEETGLYYYGARYYTPDLSVWLSVDPLSDKRPNQSPFMYCSGNPVILTDPTGALDEVFITGPDAENATAELQKSSSLGITRDANTGKLSATGKAKTDADKILLEAIQSKTVVVNLETKSESTYNSKDGSKGWPLVPGGFEGSEVKDGKTIATQYINFGATQNIASIVGEQTSETITHEINEAYIGGRDYPGGDYNSAYQQSHTKAANADRVKANIEFNKNTKSDPNNIIMQGRQTGSSTWIDIIKIPK